MATYNLTAPLRDDDVKKLQIGDVVSLSGIIYTARDAAHKRIVEALGRGEVAPFPLVGAVIYYVGPAPAPSGRVIGSAGPTTGGRMDAYAPLLHSLGVKATIGKGKRNDEVRKSLQDYTGVYFGATGGAGALLSQCIKKAEVIAYPELGTEAVHRLLIKDFPLLVVNDSYGAELYAEANLVL